MHVILYYKEEEEEKIYPFYVIPIKVEIDRPELYWFYPHNSIG